MAEELNNSFHSYGNYTIINDTEPFPTGYLWIVGVACGASILANTFTIYTLNLTESLQKTENLLYKVLAISDILCAVSQASIGTSMVLKSSGAICEMMFLSLQFTVSFSLLIIVMINVNRFIMIMRPLHHPRLVRPKRLICAFLLGMSGVIVILIVVYHLGIDSILFIGSICQVNSSQSNKMAVTLLICAPILLGFVIIVIANTGILYKSRQQARQIEQMHRSLERNHQKPDENNLQGRHRPVAANGLKGLRTVGALTISYFVVWLPFFIIISGLYLSLWFGLIEMLFQMVNTMWNPLILCIANKPFRNASKMVILKIKPGFCGRVH